jgi:ribosomal protein L6P/L9E
MKYENLVNLNDVSLFRYKDHIIFLSSKGRIVLDMSKTHSNFCYQISSDSLKINKSLPIECKLESIINGLSEFYHKKLNLVGIGFRSWCYFDKVKSCQVLCIKVGFSKDVLISIPGDVIILCLKPTLILVRGVDKDSVSLMTRKIKSIKKPDAYKGKGIRYENEVIHLKPGKQK